MSNFYKDKLEIIKDQNAKEVTICIYEKDNFPIHEDFIIPLSPEIRRMLLFLHEQTPEFDRTNLF